MRTSSTRALTASQLVWLFGVYSVVEVASVGARALGSPVLPPFRLATGIAVVGFVLASRKQLPWLVAAQVVIEFVTFTVLGRIESPALHLLEAGGIACECLAGALLFRRFSLGETGGRLREVMVVLASALLPTSLVAFPIALGFEVLVPELHLPVLPAALEWATSESVGVLLLVPLAFTAPGRSATTRQRVRGVVAGTLTTALIAWFFFAQVDVTSPLRVLSFAVFPLFLMSGYFFGIRGAATGSAMLAAIVTVATLLVLGPFSSEANNFDRHAFAQLFVLLVAASSLIVGGLTEDERRARESLQKALRDVHDSTSRLQRLFAASVEATIIFDQEGRVVAVNEAFTALAQRAVGAQPVLGEPRSSFEARAGKAWLEASTASWERALAGESVATRLPAGPDTGALELRAALLRDANGVVIGVTQHLVDLDASNREQQQRARRERLESLGRLAGGIAHDFNNLLTVIIGHASVLAGSLVEEEANQDAAEIILAGERAAILTRQLLQFARRERVEPRVIDLVEQTRLMQPLLERLAGENIRLVVEHEGSPLPLCIAPGHLEQVLLNVVANARDAMPEGGCIRLRLRAASLTPELAAQRDMAPGAVVVLEVRDEGVGMSAELLEHIFEPFFSTKPSGKGTGLGLATTEGIIRQAHGAVTVESAPGRGTTFSFFFPRSEGRIEVDSTRTGVTDRALRHETVLLVEDETALRALAARLLRHAGYQVLEAARGDTALAVARAHPGPIELLTSDVVLPGGNGTALAETLQQERPMMKVLFVSGYSDQPLPSLPGSAFLPKPYTPEQLLARARKTLG